MTWRKIVLGLGMVWLGVLFGTQGCGGGNKGSGNSFDFDASAGGDGAAAANNQQICLLNNCTYDRDCKDCTGGRVVCKQDEHRCIACGTAAEGNNCPQGQACTQYGNCVPTGVTCATDSQGNPSVSCHSDADCAACDPHHMVCDTGSNKCVGCTGSNVGNCQSTDACTNDACVPKCPTSCATDGDCGQCGAPGKEAHACNRHVCGQCSPTKGCPSGQACDFDHGTCVKTCGLPGSGTQHTCKSDADCGGCTGTTTCSIPLGGQQGTCAVPASGCSDLGKAGSALALPAPFSSVTNTCSNDADCSSVNTNIDVGQLLKDATGLSFFNSATLSYPEHACGSVDIPFTGSGDAGPLKCGVCVPCKADADCTDISIDSFVTQLLGPIGDIATDLLLDKVFGPNDHKIHMYCQNVAGDYGVCVPCPSILNRCSTAGGSQIPPNPNCDHDVCTKGDALGPQCSEPTTTVCGKDAYCCETEWDDLCISEVDEYSKTKACTPVDCTYKDDGTYCNESNPSAGYVCTNHSVSLGTVNCATGKTCKTTTPNDIKSAAMTNPDGSLACQ